MSKICQKCSCQNDERYIFCKNCGTPLIEGELYANSPYENVGEYTEPTEQDNGVYGGAQIDGVAVNEITLFVGKNSEKIIPKFARLDGKDGKNTWCWPAAILGGLLGFMGAALWLLYRKMYKLAFLAIGIALVL
ncbi:MAG: zinc ribbon domain-containing protein, partial [Clostridia bacterium]|nr:zinc ribbon domain-containing protein [Clostridia bacterium]